jgi:hypothetical protein
MAHIPTPWRVGPYGGIYPIDTGPMIASSYTKSGCLPRATENEAFIVEAVNSHDKLQADRDALLKALKEIREYAAAYDDDEVERIAGPAIAQVEGKDTK